MSRIVGLAALSANLKDLDKRLGLNALSRAVGKAATPTVRLIRSRAPKGTKKDVHKTYTGRKVFAGFLKKSIRRRTRKNRRLGSVEVQIGVLKEAFYGVQFLDKGITVTSRRSSKGKRSDTSKLDRRGRGTLFNRRSKKIKAYSIQGRRWFEQTFRQRRFKMQEDLRKQLSVEIEKATKRGA